MFEFLKKIYLLILLIMPFIAEVILWILWLRSDIERGAYVAFHYYSIPFFFNFLFIYILLRYKLGTIVAIIVDIVSFIFLLLYFLMDLDKIFGESAMALRIIYLPLFISNTIYTFGLYIYFKWFRNN